MQTRSSCLKTACRVQQPPPSRVASVKNKKSVIVFLTCGRADMRREKKEADRKRKSEMLEAFAKYFAPNMQVFFWFHFNGAIRYLMATSWLGPETHWRNAEDKIKQEFAE